MFKNKKKKIKHIKRNKKKVETVNLKSMIIESNSSD
jgi:hypothetical protein